MAPDEAGKLKDRHGGNEPPQTSLSSDLSRLLAATTLPMPAANPDAILEGLQEERLRLQYEAELAYLRGDFQRTMRCFAKTEGDAAARLRACPVAIAAAISLGDYRAFAEIDAHLKRLVRANEDPGVPVLAELALATASVSMVAPNMAPGWLKDGDFSALAPEARLDALYLRSKYFQCLGRYEATLAVAQTALSFRAPEQGMTTPDVYLWLMPAIACYSLGRVDEARHHLLEAMDRALPHGFVTPFAEHLTALGGLVEQCLERKFPDFYDPVIDQWKRTWKNWMAFHNEFAKDNITLILSLREYHIALLVARHVPYAEVAKQHCISVGRLKNIMMEIYGKLYISSRDELARYVL